MKNIEILFTSFLLTSQLDTAPLKIAYVVIYFLACVYKGEIRFYPKNLSINFIWVVLGAGAFMSIIYILNNNLNGNVLITQIYRIRYHLIEIFFAISLYYKLKSKSRNDIKNIVVLGLLMNIVVGLFQLLLLNADRISFMFFEPSAAGLFYVVMLPLCLGIFNETTFERFICITFLIFGIGIFSKAQLIIAPLILFLQAPKKVKVWTFLFLSIILYLAYLFQQERIDSIVRVVHVLANEGMLGLNESNQIWTSWSLRLSSAYIAIFLILSNPFGIGFGSFNSEYILKMHELGLSKSIRGEEISEVLKGTLYATPKSSLLEIFVSCGLISIFLYFKIFRNMWKDRQTIKPIFYSFVGLTLSGLSVELAPVLTYMVLLTVLKEKFYDQV